MTPEKRAEEYKNSNDGFDKLSYRGFKNGQRVRLNESVVSDMRRIDTGREFVICVFPCKVMASRRGSQYFVMGYTDNLHVVRANIEQIERI